ncbi:hypothetical protein L6272_05790, partial [Microgenomates group bacterium]|nr:hypothetical protein [Microgenomates group bacterium]
MDQITALIAQAKYLVLIAFLLGLGMVGLVGVLYVFAHWLKFKDREKRSLEFVVLQIAVPRDNEVKIDGAEQMFASLFSVKKGGGFLGFMKPQDHLSFEIVAKKEDIRFYVSVPERLKDLVEKQIHGTYPGADIKEVDEYNVFSDHGKVAFAAMKLANASFYPIQIYKDLPTDPLSSLTAGLAKMGDNEGAVVQVLISPADKKWQKAGRSFTSKTKKEEADPETAKYNIDPKTYEEIESKCSKPGFETMIRMVVSSTTKESAEAHLSNLTSSFSQYNSDHNSFTKIKIRLKKLFMIDFIYRYQPLFGSKSILSTEELATIYHF